MSSRRFALVVAGSLAGLLLAVSPGLSQGNSPASEANYPTEITQPGGFPPEGHEKGHPKERPLHYPHIRPRPGNLGDPVVQTSTPTPAAALGLGQWEGLGSAYPGFTITAVPPDPNLAVGPNHIVQWVNNALVIFDKQGNQLQAPVADSTFWGALSTCYQGGGFSDPIIEYDRAADRWVVGEVAIPAFPGLLGVFAQCFAVSKTSDPTWTSDANGNNTSYNIWAYGFGTNVNDYDKISVWPDAYYVTWNIFQNGTTFIGPEVCAWNRNQMLNGVAAPSFKCFQLTTAYASVLPADLDGSTSPPAGSPNFLMDVNPSTGALDLWTFHVDTANFSNSTLSNPTSIPVAPFTVPCLNAQTGQISQDCIPQDGTTQMVDALGDRLMYRLAYRNFGDHESLVANHTVMTAGGNTGVRWYEVRSPNSTPTLYQQGTFAPDSDNRWMASIAMDQSGNIGLGYSVASAATFDSIRYTGWEVGNPLGTLETESSLVAGGGAQNGSNRWGDYSAMKIDPVDDCTFWYTQEYEATTDPSNIIWNTRVGSFKFPSCGVPQIATTTALGSSGATSTYGQSVTFTATVTSGSGTPAGNVTFKDGSTTLGTTALNISGVATFATAALAAGGHTITAVYDGDSTYSGSTSSAVPLTVN
ncbi:MAG TPA: Ig-like domain-containing protein, partial [Terriglobia bacterium]|nr:Ig-like domain-containing protein [Terriglobia bacterium]